MFGPRVDLVSRTNVHFLVFHLTLADAVISFVTMPMETAWRVVIEVSGIIGITVSLNVNLFIIISNDMIFIFIIKNDFPSPVFKVVNLCADATYYNRNGNETPYCIFIYASISPLCRQKST